MKAAGKKFEYEIFQEVPGAHSFDRINTKGAEETRMKIYNFLAKYLRPPTPFKSVHDLKYAAYQ